MEKILDSSKSPKLKQDSNHLNSSVTNTKIETVIEDF